VCAKDSGILAWFENLGGGRFAEHRIHEDQSAYEGRIVDMNGDGAPDILVPVRRARTWSGTKTACTPSRPSPAAGSLA
jgi:hypothetical protein